MGKILKAERELEYVAFLNVKLNTKEGFAYMFVAIDAYTGLAMSLGVERDESPESVLKNVYLLTEHKDFKSHNNHGFTLVFEDNETLAERIEAIVKSEGGKVIYNKTYNNFIANPFLLAMSKHLKKSK
jgi:hypothetical protein